MEQKPEEEPTLGEQMNNDLYLDPGFTEDKPGLVDSLRDEIGETVERAQDALHKRRVEETHAKVEADPAFESTDQT